MWRIAPFIVAGVILAVAPITGPDIPARVLEYAQPEQREATLVAVGDIMLSRTVAKKMLQHGTGYPFETTTLFLREADIVFGNLESPIALGAEVLPFEMVFRADPEAAQALQDAGFDILSLANNHTANLGPAGVVDTMRYLDGAGIMHVGAGKDDVEAGQPMFIVVNGIIFGFLAYTDSDVIPSSWEASGGNPGVATMRRERMEAAVRGAKRFADIVIVSMHSGTEYEPLPNERQVAFAHAAIDAGAEMVIGHHPHVIQPVEVYEGKYIFYSLGNFVFDQMWSEATREGLGVRATFTKEGVSRVSYHPVRIEDYARPYLLQGAEAEEIIEKATWGLPVDSPDNPS